MALAHWSSAPDDVGDICGWKCAAINLDGRCFIFRVPIRAIMMRHNIVSQCVARPLFPLSNRDTKFSLLIVRRFDPCNLCRGESYLVLLYYRKKVFERRTIM